jgi:predicted permease
MSRTEIGQMLRRLARRPGFAAAAVLTLALGIGATVAIFTVVYGVLLRPFPYADSERLVGLWHSAPALGMDQLNQSYGSYTLYRERARTIEDAGLYDVTSFNVAGSGEPERLIGARATASVFSVLGVTPIAGRFFSAEEDAPEGPDVLILSHGFWQRRFAGSPDAVGAVLQLDGKPWEVIGVMPAGFAFPDDRVEIWVPHPISTESLSEVDFSFDAVARLRPGVTVEQASAELDALLPELPEAYPGALSQQLLEESGIEAFANSLRDDRVGDVRRVLWVLLAAVGFVLLIACANVANLLLVRTEGRQRELAVRLAMGASRGRLARGLMAESVFLAALGGLLGVGLAAVGIRGLARLDPGTLPRLAEIRVDAPVLAFALLVSLVAGLAFGVLPSLRLRGRVLGAALAEGGRGAVAGRESRHVRDVLVVAQVVLAVVLLFGSALMIRTFQALIGVDPGFDRASVLTLRLTLHGEERYGEAEARARFWTRLIDEARVLPGAARAATVLNLPLTDGDTNPGLIIEDFPPQPGDPPLVARQNLVSDGYFETLGIPILRGRGLDRRDVDQRRPSAVVSAAFARRVWGETSPLGKRLKRGLPTEQSAPWYEVVGVAGGVRDDDLTADPVEMVYFPLIAQEGDETGWTPWSMSLAVAVEGGDPARLGPAVRDLVRRLDGELPVIRMRTTAEITRGAMARTTFTMALLGVASVIALVLGSIGIYGVLSHSVAQRTREIGVRLALGAGPGTVFGALVGQGLRLTGVGVVLGLAGAVVAGRVLGALLFGVEAGDPLSLIAVVALLILVAAAASFVPAQRAARIAPTEALRYE